MRERVESTAVSEMAYDPRTQRLEVAFPPSRKTGESAVWSYQPVRPEVYDEIRSSQSIGMAFGRLVKGDAAIVATRLPNVVLDAQRVSP
jgi:hypothetical protein